MNQLQGFDPLAVTYDHRFTHTPIGQYLRDQVHARLEQYFHTGDHVLELGCGTGEDALRLAARGVRVTATDVSAGMLTAAGEKTAGNPLIEIQYLDLRAVGTQDNVSSDRLESFDGVFSNFGPMNCLEDWKPLAGWLAERVRPGRMIGLGVMSPFCVWEPVWHGLHGDFKTATRRWRKKTTFRADEASEAITVTYPTIGRLTGDFSAYFRRKYIQGLGIFLPPSDVYGVIEKRPRLFKALLGLEKRFGEWGKLALVADHYWIEFERI
jgi:SAM-dependent methyltransferase